MPEQERLRHARRDAAQGKVPTTQAGEFVREEIEHIRRGKHGARSTKQAIAIGLSKARRAGVDLPAPKKGTTSEETRKKAERDTARAHSHSEPSKPRPGPPSRALKEQPKSAASHSALSRQAKQAAAARKRSK